MENTKSRCKKLLLRDGYGKFVLVERLISAEKLSSEKPMIIYLELRELLGNEALKLNRNSFYTWLRRWRKKNQKNLLPAQKEKNWMDFQAPPLSSVESKTDSVVLEFLKPQ